MSSLTLRRKDLRSPLLKRLYSEIMRYGMAGIAESWKGSKHPDDHDAITAAYHTSRKRLAKTLQEIDAELLRR